MNGEPLVKWTPAVSLGDVGHLVVTLVLLIAGYVHMSDRVSYLETVHAQDVELMQNETQLLQSMQVSQATETTILAELQRRVLTLEAKVK